MTCRVLGWVGLVAAILVLAVGSGYVIAAQGSGCHDGSWTVPATWTPLPPALDCSGACPPPDPCVQHKVRVGNADHYSCVCDGTPGVPGGEYSFPGGSLCMFSVVVTYNPTQAAILCGTYSCPNDCAEASQNLPGPPPKVKYYCDCP